MSLSFSLAVYAITINQRRKTENRVVLSDFNHGTDLLKEIENLLKSWCYNSRDTHVEKDKEEEKVFRIAKDINGNDILYSVGRSIYGIIESGSYGTEEPLVNVDTGISNNKKHKNEALLRPFYFHFYIPKDSLQGFLILERISSFGIYSLINKRFSTLYRSEENLDLVFRIAPLTVKALAEQNIKQLDYSAKKIVIHQLVEEDLKISRITGNTIQDEEVKGHDVVYKAPVNKFINVGKWIEKLKRKEGSPFYVVDKDIKFSGVDLEIRVGEKTRMLSVDDIQKSLGTTMDITDHVIINNDNGYPTFDSLKNESMVIISYINQQYKL